MYARQLQERNKALLLGKTTRSSDLIGQKPPSDVTKSSVIRILSWTTDNHTQWPEGTSIFDQCNLPNGNTCENYIDRKRLKESDVLFFHAQAINPRDLPQVRSPKQKWLFYEFEMPPQTWIQQESLDPIRNVFNLTSTIAFDSHIPILERHSQCYLSKGRLAKNTKMNVDYAEGKGHRVAWFVSHCDTQSRREKYAEALSKYIPVDIVGKCGNLTCGHKHKRGNCDETVINPNYKFYLSFENSLCQDYVTEKLWRLLMKPISAIPIVLGSVDYKKMLPEGTYLDIKDYSSPKMLADHLKLLDHDDTAFNTFIARKNAVYCLYPGNKTFQESRYHCQLCQYLHDHRDDVSAVRDVVNFWSTKSRCTDPREYYKGSFDL
ncbi:hypothetical protein CAPTEDRAFT_133973 [Capitella teleta]|uniref:Fucosyltransferase n=1 Tax=Capitella teleta TaxID=283909 RepID=R7VFL4_CAPTE|nr:hypothetical protein CAPTEDRAFT_133973 [Capitella teleta]|eukprot:ELU14470.1 hypothetical protein CAPTEDRAFT_133973 [Capitella teleta]